MATVQPASKRARRIEEAVLEVEGVVAVRVWEGDHGRVEVGVAAAPSDAPSAVLGRVREVLESMRADDEEWDVGLLTEVVFG